VIAQSPKNHVRKARARRAAAPAMTASPASEGPSAGEAYRLSRIQAEGWNAAHRVAASTLDRLDTTQIESLNPYASDPERARWRAGFTNALTS
jgi:hypothetical protein